MFRYLPAYLIAFVISLTHLVNAETPATPPPIEVSLITENETIQPGHPFWVITKLQMQEGWHTYWKNPGDAGMATSIEWNLPEGFKASSISWPTPKRFALESIIGYGYDSEVLLLTQITPPQSLKQDKPIEIKANTRWLICSESSCMPGEAEQTASLNTSTVTPKVKIDTSDYFARARSQLPEQVNSYAHINKNAIELHVPMPRDGLLPTAVYFCPEDQDVIDHSVDAIVKPSSKPNYFSLLLKKKDSETNENGNRLKGIVVTKNGRNRLEPATQAIEVNTPIHEELDHTKLMAMSETPSNNDLQLSENSTPTPLPTEFSGGFAMALLLAFIGGMILNLMPCVLPVMSFKVLGFVKMAGQSRSLTLKHGIVFAIGVLISFWVLAGVLLVLQAYGRSVGWGFQLQEPLFVAILAGILLIFGLSLFGLFEVGTGVIALAGNMGRKREGLSSSFFSGILATAVATPCTGPFLGSAVGFAVTLPSYQAMLVFTSLGLGMSLPYLLLAAFPSLLRFMPKPGEWMETFKQLMGFLMLASVLWLVWVFAAQTSSLAVTLLLVGFFCLALGCWIYGKWGTPVHNRLSRMTSSIIALLCVVAAGYAMVLSTSQIFANDNQEQVEDVAWEPFSATRVAELQKQGIPVLVDFTAKWCLICQVNHMVLSTDSVDEKLSELGVVKMKADWTSNDPAITEELRKYGRNSVPLYLLYGKNATQPPEIMPQVLTQDIVLDYLDKI